jgi:hypothetical protein
VDRQQSIRWIIVRDFSKRSKLLSGTGSGKKVFFWIWPFLVLLFVTGCFYSLDIKRSVPLRVDPRDFQPIALVPISDAKGVPSSGSTIYRAALDFMRKRGYLLVDSAEVSQTLERLSVTPLSLFSNPDLAQQFAAQCRAKLLLMGIFAEYRPGKSYLGAQTEQVWEGGLFDYRTLPTYYWAHSRMRFIFKLVDSETGRIVWMAEGVLRGPSRSFVSLGKRLTERLLEDFPSLPPGFSPASK